jgi:hypothetical protein
MPLAVREAFSSSRRVNFALPRFVMLPLILAPIRGLSESEITQIKLLLLITFPGSF